MKAPFLVIVNNIETCRATDDEVNRTFIKIDPCNQMEVNAILLQEYIRLGQRVRSFSVEVWYDDTYTEASTGTTIGNRRIVRFDSVNTDRIRINIEAKASLLISNIEIYCVPEDASAYDIRN